MNIEVKRTSKKMPVRAHKKAEVRQSILLAAKILFRANGYVATSMTEIARGAGISRKTLFNYMPSKESIVYAMIDTFFGEHVPGWLESDKPHFNDARDVTTPDLYSRLEELGQNRWLLTLAAEHTRFFSSDHTPLISDVLSVNVKARAARIAAVQAMGKIRKELSPLDISFYYEVLRDLTLRRWLLQPDSTIDELTQAFSAAMSVLQAGIAAPGAASPT